MSRRIRLLAGVCLALVLLLPCVACSSTATETTQSGASENAAASTASQASESAQDFDRAELIKMAIENQKYSYAP